MRLTGFVLNSCRRVSGTIAFTLCSLTLIFCMANAANATLLAYYPLDTPVGTSGNTPDVAPTGTAYDATLTAGTSGTPSITSGGMFGNALSVPGTANRAQVADGATDFDVLYDQFSLSVWIKPTGVDTAANRYIVGKSGPSGQRGWFLRTNSGATINQLQFSYPRVNTSGSTSDMITALLAPLSTTEYTHVAVQFDNYDTPGGAGAADVDTYARLYVNGILQTSATSISSTLNGSNNAPFQIGNRGDTLNTAAEQSFNGMIDDLALANDPSTPETIALIHGLGRLAGVSIGESAQIAAVLSAYGTHGFGVAGTGAATGTTWYWHSAVGAGPVGTIGGTVAGGDAFIVLGSDGSGVSVVPIPEPGSFMLLAIGMIGLSRSRQLRRD